MFTTDNAPTTQSTVRSDIYARPCVDSLASTQRLDVPGAAEPGHLHLAREIYEHILSAQPDHLESLIELGQLSLEQGDNSDAIEKLTKAIEVDPQNAQAYYHLGRAYDSLGEYRQAEAAQRRAVELNPKLTDAHYDLGVNLNKQSKFAEATSSFQQALRLDQSHGRAYHQLGSALEQQGAVDQALVCYQEARLQELIDAAFKIGMLQIRSEIEALARTLLVTNPQNIMEIGSHRGGTMYLWCHLLNNGGKRIAIDLPDGEFGGLAKEEITQRNAMMARWSDQLTCIDADSHDVSTYQKVVQMLGEEKLDFLFIDGDHSYDGVKLDYFMYKSLVRPGGLIAFHDIKETQLHRDQNCHVAWLWKELSGEKMEIRAEAEWGGIGLIQC